jgi:peptide/nickel transport system permease protein
MNKTVKVAGILLALFCTTYIVDVLPLADPLHIEMDQRLMKPSFNNPFGTDELGRSVLSRVLHGYATTIWISVLALVSSLFIGIIAGGLAGYLFQTWFDRIFNWMAALIMSLPFLLVMASIMSLARPNILHAYLILTLIMWVQPARIVRAEVARTKNLDYIRTMFAFGSSDTSVLLRDILPSCMQASMIFSLSYLPEIVGLEAGLSFIGLGVQPPYPGLGKMIFDGLDYLYSAWWISFFPAFMLFLAIFLINGGTLHADWHRRNMG